MPGKANGFVVYALHQAAIARDHPGAMIDQRSAECGIEPPLGNRHAHRHRQTLTQWPGGAFDARDQMIFRVPRANAVELAEFLNVGDRGRGIAGEIQQRINQH